MTTRTETSSSSGRDSLANGLRAVLGEPVEILDRRPNAYASTFASEIVRCRTAGGATLNLFCKWGGNNVERFGHKGGVPYEAEIYGRVLEPLKVTTIRCYGAHSADSPPGQTLLVLEALRDHLRVSKAVCSTAMPEAAGWIGRFHAAGERIARRDSDGVLNRYDAEYYRGWIERTAEFASARRRRFNWLGELRRWADEIADRLLALCPTIIHGEYTTSNVLVHQGRSFPIDWESAAIAAGEIDLAMLLDGEWPAEIAEACKRAYADARGDENGQSDMEHRLALARVYMHCRWLGERAHWTGRSNRFADLKDAAEAAGLL